MRVHIINDDKLVIYGSLRSCSQLSTRFPLLRRPPVFNVPFWIVWWASITGLPVPVCRTFNELRGAFWLSDLVFPRLSDAIETSTFGSLTRYRNTKYSSSALILLWLFLHLHLLVFFSTSLQDYWWNCKWLMLNKHRRWFHSSRVKVQLVSMPASWFFGVNVFDLDFGVQIDSIKQPIKSKSVSSGIMLIVVLLPFMIILITASLSSKKYKASFREECTFEKIKSTVSESSIIPWDFFRVGSLCGGARTKFVHGSPCSSRLWIVFPRTATIRSHNQMRVYRPTSILRPRKLVTILQKILFLLP